ncbi:MAG: S49 family peptidase [Candidatus Roizmanbacteria bacterium]
MPTIFSFIRSKKFILGICIFAILCAGVIISNYERKSIQKKSGSNSYDYLFVNGNESSDHKLLTIPINGIILTEQIPDVNPFDLFGGMSATYGYEMKEKLYKLADDPSIEGIVFEIDSPGGTVTGSKAISDGIEYYRNKTKKPIIAHVVGEGLSGAYWSASATDWIIADTGCLTGSIGVLLGPMKYYDTVLEEGNLGQTIKTKDGISTTYFTSGTYKDTGSPYRKMSVEEITHWQKSVDIEYAIFLDHVKNTRKLSEDTIRNVIKALPYENERALKLRLIDAIGSKEFAYKELAKRAHLKKNDYQIVKLSTKQGFLSSLFSSFSKSKSSQANNLTLCILCNKPLFLHDPNLFWAGK